MTSEDPSRSRDGSRRRFLCGLSHRIEAIESAYPMLREGAEPARQMVRRLARQIREGARRCGFDDVEAAAARLDEETDDNAIFEEVRLLHEALAAIETPARREWCVLVVDDDAGLGEALCETLDGIDREAHWVGNIRSARAFLEKERVDLVVLDLGLPDGDGRELLTDLGGRAEQGGPHVLVLSGGRVAFDKTECLALGADGFLDKPVECTLLLGTVLTLLERRRQLTEASRYDRLTGLLNRAGFESQVAGLRALCERNRTPISLALLDIDHFKEVNDVFGHARGDAVLVRFATTLRDVLRASDVVARWGGEEFIVALPDANLASAERALERVRRRLASQTDPPVDFSAGLVAISAEDDLEASIERADTLMYDAKTAGRGRTSRADRVSSL